MFQRCYNPNCTSYSNYGGRGIAVCERWRGKTGFAHFLADVGPRPSAEYSIDRWPNNDGNYEPGNVRWATDLDQANNASYNRRLTVNGETHTAAEWCRIRGFGEGTVIHRMDKLGWPAERAVMTPITENATEAMHNWRQQLTPDQRAALSSNAGTKRWAKDDAPKRMITANGITHSLSEWSRLTGIKPSTISMRIDAYGMTPELALTRKVKAQ